MAASSDAWPGTERCWTRWPDIPRGWCRPCKTAQGVQEMGTPRVYPHGPIGELSRLSAADRLVPEDYKPRISDEERATIPSYGELIVERLEDLGAFTVSRRPLQSEALDLLALTADYPVEHPLRQAAARLTTRLARAEGKIATATAVLERAAVSGELSVIGLRTDQALEILKR